MHFLRDSIMYAVKRKIVVLIRMLTTKSQISVENIGDQGPVVQN